MPNPNYEKAYREGADAYQQGKRLLDNPYRSVQKKKDGIVWEVGGIKWQAWINGFCDAGDKDFLALVKKHPQLLMDK